MIRACPLADVGVSADVAWSFVTDTSKLDSWWDARLVSAEPAGPMAVGQHIEARANGLRVTLDVLEVDAPTRTVRLFVRLPLGMTNDMTVAIWALEPKRCAIGFG
jgi:hypothetical protein